jgi:hypothetical protein
MSDYKITRRDPSRQYPKQPEIKVGEYEETQVIYGIDALEKQVRRIAELERIAQKQADALNVLRGSIAAYQVGKHEARIAELEAALKPFADISYVLEETDSGTIYEWALDCDDIRAARAALEKKNEGL